MPTNRLYKAAMLNETKNKIEQILLTNDVVFVIMKNEKYNLLFISKTVQLKYYKQVFWRIETMKVHIVKDYEEMSNKAAQIIAEEIRKKPNLVMALPTGGTPTGTLAELVRMHREGGLDFSDVISLNIDEYIPLKPDNPQSYYYYLNEYLYKHVNIKPENTYVPNVVDSDLQKACKEYDELIDKLGDLDFILLGIGNDGHIGFNMPGPELIANTHIENLNEDTIKANSRFFDNINEVPKQALTSGVGIILRAKKIVLIANGKNKAEAIDRLLNQQVINPMLPASLLWLHRDVTVIIDEEAAQVYRNKYT